MGQKIQYPQAESDNLWGEQVIFPVAFGEISPHVKTDTLQALSSDLTCQCCFDFSQIRATQIWRAQILSVPTVAMIIITAKHTRPTASPVRPLQYWKMHSSTFRLSLMPMLCILPNLKIQHFKNEKKNQVQKYKKLYISINFIFLYSDFT